MRFRGDDLLKMLNRSPPFALEAPLSHRLEAVRRYWKGLMRGAAAMPLADDLDMTRIKARCPDVFVLGVLERPLRFRLDLAYLPSAPEVERRLVGGFVEDAEPRPPLHQLRAQATATVADGAPTLHEQARTASQRGYGRLLLPAWAEGQARLLLGAVEWR